MTSHVSSRVSKELQISTMSHTEIWFVEIQSSTNLQSEISVWGQIVWVMLLVITMLFFTVNNCFTSVYFFSEGILGETSKITFIQWNTRAQLCLVSYEIFLWVPFNPPLKCLAFQENSRNSLESIKGFHSMFWTHIFTAEPVQVGGFYWHYSYSIA